MALEDIPIWEWCWVTFTAISALMHIMVMATIIRARQRKANNILKSPFFTIIFIEGLHEILTLLTSTGLNRLRKYRVIEYALVDHHDLIKWQWYWFCYLKGVLYLGHVETALNRLSAVILFKEFGQLWNTKNIIYMNLLGYGILALARAIIYALYFPDLKVSTSIKNGTDLLTLTMDPAEELAFESSADIALSLGTGIICILSYSTAAIRQRQQGFVSVITKRQEATLLRIGIITFLIFLPTTIRSAIDAWANLTGSEALRAFVSKWNMLPAEAMCMVQPWLLLIFCRRLRETMFSTSTTKISTAFTTSSSQPTN